MSTSRQRQQKRRSPGVIRNVGASGERAAVEHGVQQRFGLSWRTFSGFVVVVLILLLAMFFSADIFYVRSVAVSGTNFLDQSEVFRAAGIAEMHVFWIDPEAVRQRIIQESRVIADARVRVGWPPDMVTIRVEEREPVVIWSQAGVTALVDLQGTALRFPPDGEDLPDLIQVVADGSGPPGVDAPIPVDAINGALQLRTIIAGLPALRYNEAKGLGFREESWDVWLGVGTDMANKLRIYDTVRDDLLARGITPFEINVANPEAAYYCGNVEGC